MLPTPDFQSNLSSHFPRGQDEAIHSLGGIHENTWFQCPEQTPVPSPPGVVAYPDRMNIDPPDVSLPATENLKTTAASEGQRCDHPGCPERRIFKQGFAFKKHMDKHLRPYRCQVPTCTVNPFATAGDLKRHEREVHSTPAYNCPITTCKRNRRGFSRKDNLVQHMSRTHDQAQDMGHSIASSSFSPPTLALGNESLSGETFMVQDSLGSNGNLESTNTTSTSVDNASLMAKLSELESERMKAIARFDEKIAALKTVLSFM